MEDKGREGMEWNESNAPRIHQARLEAQPEILPSFQLASTSSQIVQSEISMATHDADRSEMLDENLDAVIESMEGGNKTGSSEAIGIAVNPVSEMTPPPKRRGRKPKVTQEKSYPIGQSEGAKAGEQNPVNQSEGEKASPVSQSEGTTTAEGANDRTSNESKTGFKANSSKSENVAATKTGTETESSGQLEDILISDETEVQVKARECRRSEQGNIVTADDAHEAIDRSHLQHRSPNDLNLIGHPMSDFTMTMNKEDKMVTDLALLGSDMALSGTDMALSITDMASSITDMASSSINMALPQPSEAKTLRWRKRFASRTDTSDLSATFQKFEPSTMGDETMPDHTVGTPESTTFGLQLKKMELGKVGQRYQWCEIKASRRGPEEIDSER